MADEEKKIYVDDDWKQQAKAEKEKLAEEAKKEKEGSSDEGKEFPEGNFSNLVSMLATQVLFALGVVVPKELEDQKKPEPDFNLAKYNIDILNDLQEKTKGNLSDDEAKMLKDTATQLQMAFVQIKNSPKEDNS